MGEKFSESILWQKGYRLNEQGHWYLPAHAAAGLPAPIKEPHLRHEPERTDAGKEDCTTGRLRLVITSYRVKLCDPGNLEFKFIVDALRYGKIIVNDSPKEIAEIAVRQVQVPHFLDEHTEIQILSTNIFSSR